MHIPTNTKPIRPRGQRVRTELGHSALFTLFPTFHSPLRQQPPTPSTLRNSAVAKLERVSQRMKMRPSPHLAHEEALLELRICLDSVGSELQQALSVQMKKNLSCRNILSRNGSPRQHKEDASKQKMKNYFKHLNMEAQNHSSFIGTSAFLHHRQNKPRSKHIESQLGSRGYRNGLQSLLLRNSPKQATNALIETTIKNEANSNNNEKPLISPWQSRCQDGAGLVMAKAIVIRNSRVTRMKTQ